MAQTRWSDPAFHETLRRESDERADETVRELFTGVDDAEVAKRVSYLFRTMNANGEPLPDDAPPPVRRFFSETGALPPGVDAARIARAEGIFMKHAFSSSLVLLTKAVPEGYSAPTFGKILHLSADLERHPYRRLLGVLQMVVNVCSSHGFAPGGSAIVTAQKLRLMHAAIRVHIVPRYLPHFEAKWGRPISKLDMLATLMGFSYLVVDGLKTLGVGMSPEEGEDYYYLWKVYAHLMGLYPRDAPGSFEYVPAGLEEAREFYQTYSRSNYVEARENPEGVRLAQDNLKMLENLIPRYLRLFGLGSLPALFSYELIGAEGCARVGIPVVRGRWLLKKLLAFGLHLSHDAARAVPGHISEAFSRLLFREMIHRSWGGQVTFLFPDTLADVRKLA